MAKGNRKDRNNNSFRTTTCTTCGNDVTFRKSLMVGTKGKRQCRSHFPKAEQHVPMNTRS